MHPNPPSLLLSRRERLTRELPGLLRELEFALRTLGKRPHDRALRQASLVSAHGLAQRSGSYGFDEAARLCRTVSAFLYEVSPAAAELELDLLADGLSSAATALSRAVPA